MTVQTNALGAAGERAALGYLTRHGYTLIVARWRCPQGEIDLIMRQGTEIVFVEVRTRAGVAGSGFEAAGAALESINARKQAKLIACAEEYLAQNGLEDSPWRIDCAAVTERGGLFRVEVVENAVGW